MKKGSETTAKSQLIVMKLIRVNINCASDLQGACTIYCVARFLCGEHTENS